MAENIDVNTASADEKTEKAKKAPKAAKELEAMKAEFEKAQAESADLKDKLLRTMAEYDNYRKRTAKEKEMIYPEATKKAVEKFLPVLDNFERALAAPTTDEGYKKGVEMIYSSMLEAFKALGVEEIAAMGEEFNPEMHNAVMHVEDEALGENVICEVLAKGYKLGDSVIRYAMVKVAN